MAPLSPHISLTALAQVRSITVPDSSKPNLFIFFCDFHFKKAGLLTIPVAKYCKNGDAPPVGAYVSLTGPFWMQPGSDGEIEADTFDVVSDNAALTLNLPPPSVFAIGSVATVIERDIHMDVGAFNRNTRSVVTYQIIVTVPNNPRRANMKMPQPGSNVAIRGILSYIAIHEDIPAVELENITYLPRTDFSSPNSNSPVGARTKRQLIAGQVPNSIDIGRPMKKTKSGPGEAFTPEELGAGSSSEANSSQSSINSSPPPSVGSSVRTRSTTSSQSSNGSFTSPVKGITKTALKSQEAKAQKEQN